jgi:hypothetical protein
MRAKFAQAIPLLVILLSGCANTDAGSGTSTIDLEYEAKLLEYKVCIEASAERWKKQLSDLPGDVISGLAKKECEKLFPTP